ncbi:hypothetical protein FQN54_005192 [Arachnomyces sp. PD_36]|nr:hypothetical protein FQN54_005192 [Arachnomyces sp. PD_36]
MAAPGLDRGNSPVGYDDADEDDFDINSELSADHEHSRSNARDDILSADPLAEGLNEPISFKRKQREPPRSMLSNLFPFQSSTSQSHRSRGSDLQRELPDHTSIPVNLDSNSEQNGAPGRSKDGNPLDWYTEGPGRRVGYDDMTAIDWIFEYTKERQRIRLLSSGSKGFLRQLRFLLDASQVWLVLIATGVAVGVLAACIDIASNWLGDIKTGYCQSGGSYYLNKSFCCWGYDEWSECQGWKPWREAFNVESESAGFAVEYFFFVIYSVFFAICAGMLVKYYAVYAKHSGIPEIKTVLGGFVIKRFMGVWTLIVKSLGLCLSVASGLWLGKEGPLVHVACCCANLIMKPLTSINQNEARKREILSAAAASGISVAFGSPIGGVLFSLEQLSYYFPDKTMWQSFVCAMVAAVTLHTMNPFRTGKIVLYQVTYTRGWHRFEIIPFALLGIVGGLYGGLFIKLNMKIANWRKNRRNSYPILEVTIVALVTAAINFPNIFMRAPTTSLVHSLFLECEAITDNKFDLCQTGSAAVMKIILLLAAAVLAFFLASVTFGLDIPAGIILPSVAIGALYGRALGIAMEMWQRAYPDLFLFSNCEPDTPCVTPGIYAIIGAASALGGVTRMTVSIVVIMFELTGALTYVIPIMIAVMLSKWCGDTFSKRGIYESWIHFNQYPFLDHKEDTAPPDVPVSQIMTSIDDLTVIPATGHTVQSLRDLLSTHRYRGFPVVLDISNPVLLGYISRNELSYALSNATSSKSRNLPSETPTYFAHQPFEDPRDMLDLRPWMDQTPITLNSQTTFQIMLSMFQRLGLRYVLFVNKGLLQGFLTKKDVWFILNSSVDRRDNNIGPGVLREEGEAEEERGLLASDDASSMNSHFDAH